MSKKCLGQFRNFEFFLDISKHGNLEFFTFFKKIEICKMFLEMFGPDLFAFVCFLSSPKKACSIIMELRHKAISRPQTFNIHTLFEFSPAQPLRRSDTLQDEHHSYEYFLKPFIKINEFWMTLSFSAWVVHYTTFVFVATLTQLAHAGFLCKHMF